MRASHRVWDREWSSSPSKLRRRDLRHGTRITGHTLYMMAIEATGGTAKGMSTQMRYLLYQDRTMQPRPGLVMHPRRHAFNTPARKDGYQMQDVRNKHRNKTAGTSPDISLRPLKEASPKNLPRDRESRSIAGTGKAGSCR